MRSWQPSTLFGLTTLLTLAGGCAYTPPAQPAELGQYTPVAGPKWRTCYFGPFTMTGLFRRPTWDYYDETGQPFHGEIIASYGRQPDIWKDDPYASKWVVVEGSYLGFVDRPRENEADAIRFDVLEPGVRPTSAPDGFSAVEPGIPCTAAPDAVAGLKESDHVRVYGFAHGWYIQSTDRTDAGPVGHHFLLLEVSKIDRLP